jgi:hypothetical protein
MKSCQENKKITDSRTRKPIMYKKATVGIIIVGLALGLTDASAAPLKTGDEAPGFTLTDTRGDAVELAGFKGKVVVLEWTNYDCPFVRKHYGTQNMQALQRKWIDQGAIWLSICSSAPAKQGYLAADEWNRRIAEQGSAATAVLLDPDGRVGRLYGAERTPHLFVIGPEGAVQYQGALDDNPSIKPEAVKGARNYVAEAVDALLAGKPVPVAETRPYGCTVKY